MQNANASKSKNHLTALDKPPSPLLANIKTSEWLSQQEFPPLEWIVQDIVPEGSTMLVGPPKAGKSWLALNIAISVSAGKNVLGSISTEPRPVLLFALEDSHRRMKDRMEMITGKRNYSHKNLSYALELDPKLLFETIGQWLYENGDRKPLVILDTLGKAMPPSNANESAYQRDYRIGANLKKCVDEYPGSGLIMNHHNRKMESDDFVDTVSGTQGLAGSADTVIVLKRERHTDDAFLNVTGRDVEEREFPIEKSAYGWELSEPPDPNKIRLSNIKSKYGKSKQDLLDFIQEHGQVTTKECKAQFPDGHTNQWLSQLVASGAIIKVERGVYEWPAA